MRRIAALLGATAVAAGAFGAHALESRVTPERLETWHTASSYHLVHAVALLALSLAPVPRRLTSLLFLCGILIFSGSLYMLVLLDLPILGAITPLGGICFIAGWLNLARGR
ncbi:MAG: DUF423 domain-containing protein [Pseudomonadota bacterium]|nr:DUF423 domain-containing protein [Pseudomonadota bacterium]